MDNLEVYRQPPNRTQDRTLVGYLTATEMPTNDDYRMWGIDPDSVLECKRRRWNGRQCFIVVSVP